MREKSRTKRPRESNLYISSLGSIIIEYTLLSVKRIYRKESIKCTKKSKISASTEIYPFPHSSESVDSQMDISARSERKRIPE